MLECGNFGDIMTGDIPDLLSRIKSLLPPWFPSTTPVLDAILTGPATAFSWIYGFIQYLIGQTRLKTVSGNFLDLAAYDFFGTGFPRRANESDAAYRARFLPAIFQEKVTRKGITLAVQNMVGTTPLIIEPWNPGDCGGWNVPQSCGYDVAGYYGSRNKPLQMLITVYTQGSQGIPGVAGWNDPEGGYNSGGTEWTDRAQSNGPVTTPEIYDLINATKAAGTTAWVRIAPAPLPLDAAGRAYVADL
jgi:hypothetical protein